MFSEWQDKFSVHEGKGGKNLSSGEKLLLHLHKQKIVIRILGRSFEIPSLYRCSCVVTFFISYYSEALFPLA